MYTFLDVPAGPQHVFVHRIGYEPRTFHALVPRTGVLEIDVALHAEPIPLAEVEVRAPVPIRGLESTDGPHYPERSLTMAAVRHHPLVAEPDALQAASGGEIAVDPESPNGVHIRGGSADQVAYLLDGIPVLSPYHAAGTFSAWNPDALSHIDLFTASAPAPCPDALAGVVSGTTREPGTSFRSQGGISSSQARLTLDGPLGPAGLLLSGRAAFPGLLLRASEPSYLRGDGSDWLGKVETPLFFGSLQLLGSGNETEIDTSANPDLDSLGVVDPRENTFRWISRSLGASWSHRLGDGTLRAHAWTIRGRADAGWSIGDSLPSRLRSERRDRGLAAQWERTGASHATTIGLRLERMHTDYEVWPVSDPDSPLLEFKTRDPVSAAFVEQRTPLGRSTSAHVTLAGTLFDGNAYFSPTAQLRWDVSASVSLLAGYARRHQFAQSLRSTESVIGNIFPAELYVGASGNGVPVARSHQGVIAAEVRPVAGVRFGLQLYTRAFDRLALVAPHDADPFATSGFVEGSGTAHGVVLEAAANTARSGFLASYGYQDTDLDSGDLSYVPEYSASHSIDAGFVIFPSATSSIRVGTQAAFGRRGTAALGGFEWEACNLIDPGCELAGNPQRADDLGGEKLPAYFRLDLGARKHWHLSAGGRDWVLELFAGATNLLARKNILTIAIDPETGRRTEIEMRPLSPLVVGLDWRF